jgi:hypothetical protein
MYDVKPHKEFTIKGFEMKKPYVKPKAKKAPKKKK